MLQPVGGMDRIAAAFAYRLRPMIRFNAEVKQIRRTGERGARIVYRDRRTGAETAIEAPFVLTTIPLSVLKQIDNDFSPRHRAAMAAGDYLSAVKIAFEAKRRFWRRTSRSTGAFPGPARTSPRCGTHPRISTGVTASSLAPISGPRRSAKNSPHCARRNASGSRSRRVRSCIRPIAPTSAKGRGGVGRKCRFNRGAWCEWGEEAKRNAYPVLLEPDGPFLFAGEHVSNLPGWQEGAMLSAYKAIEAISTRVASRRS
jgi:monoamine oxidase